MHYSQHSYEAKHADGSEEHHVSLHGLAPSTSLDDTFQDDFRNRSHHDEEIKEVPPKIFIEKERTPLCEQSQEQLEHEEADEGQVETPEDCRRRVAEVVGGPLRLYTNKGRIQEDHHPS